MYQPSLFTSVMCRSNCSSYSTDTLMPALFAAAALCQLSCQRVFAVHYTSRHTFTSKPYISLELHWTNCCPEMVVKAVLS